MGVVAFVSLVAACSSNSTSAPSQLGVSAIHRGMAVIHETVVPESLEQILAVALETLASDHAISAERVDLVSVEDILWPRPGPVCRLSDATTVVIGRGEDEDWKSIGLGAGGNDGKTLEGTPLPYGTLEPSMPGQRLKYEYGQYLVTVNFDARNLAVICAR